MSEVALGGLDCAIEDAEHHEDAANDGAEADQELRKGFVLLRDYHRHRAKLQRHEGLQEVRWVGLLAVLRERVAVALVGLRRGAGRVDERMRHEHSELVVISVLALGLV